MSWIGILAFLMAQSMASDVPVCQTGSLNSVRVATLNLMTTEVSHSKFFGTWESRSTAIAEWSFHQQIDVLATQEGTEAMLESLSAKNLKLQKIFRPRPASDYKTEYTTLFYNPCKFQLLDQGEIWLSLTPDVPNSESWGTSTARRSVWAHLQDKRTGKDIFVFDAHFDHKSKIAREESAKLMLQSIDRIAGNRSVVLMGDLNVKSGEQTQALLKARMLDTRSSSVTPPKGSESTFIIGGWRFDYILTDVNTTACAYEVQMPRTKLGFLVSDHQPVVVDLEI
ncbi:hypothetical protein B9G69_004895 [Bdellovibrio sp. SKB1291214]|uniref:endonuclease/exonuclease/phosphatase family protein n=1 Tax=Bdellovibrio sp. SKB1291214 TaxID=1732569 RepID=UPI000B517B43|nr:endonuclease/exonuclease/phosphatase family protein [Bdellovibrio sp. SKB1291214]UYL09911.1 hypothetical protein B9G69_004895 [Bdellovibrio sp. SKB1291214]